MIVLQFVGALLLFFLGAALLLGQYKHIIRTDHTGAPVLSKREIVAVALTFLFTGALVSAAAGLVLFSNNPYWLLDVVFGAFS